MCAFEDELLHYPRATDELVLRRDAGVGKAVEQDHGIAHEGVPAQESDLARGLQPAVGGAESADSLVVVGVECLEQANRRVSCICHFFSSWARVELLSGGLRMDSTSAVFDQSCAIAKLYEPNGEKDPKIGRARL